MVLPQAAEGCHYAEEGELLWEERGGQIRGFDRGKGRSFGVGETIWVESDSAFAADSLVEKLISAEFEVDS